MIVAQRAFLASLLFLIAHCGLHAEADSLPGQGLYVSTLEQLTVDRLRERDYGTTLHSVRRIGNAGSRSFLADYDSDELLVMTRIDLPDAKIHSGPRPVMVFLHGWVGADAAPEFDFYIDGDAWYQILIEEYVAAGYIVLTPGFRGHGGADGRDYLAAWDNGSYLSPVFYAVDVLNLLAGLDTLPAAMHSYDEVAVDMNGVFLVGHSQGGDVGLIACAVSGEASRHPTAIAGASFWSGTFPDRLMQLETYYPMQSTREAFVAGDGEWNGSSIGADGSDNPNFIFAYPPDWIRTTDAASWTWQTNTWNLPSVADAWALKLKEMYDTLNRRVANLGNAAFSVSVNDSGAARIEHDDDVAAAMARVGAYHLPQYLSEPLNLHFSDRDFYSLPEWNRSLCERVTIAGGSCRAYEYPGTNHSLRISDQAWFSPPGTRDGLDEALRRDIAQFTKIASAGAAMNVLDTASSLPRSPQAQQ